MILFGISQQNVSEKVVLECMGLFMKTYMLLICSVCLWNNNHAIRETEEDVGVIYLSMHHPTKCENTTAIYVLFLSCFLAGAYTSKMKCAILGLYLLSDRASYHKISWSLEAARIGFRLS